ncbi:MAG: hypothetical protein Q8L95_11210 [Burkholderiales bacterium]|nr:hypothetical protein [Burkholderiales bacterium]
MRRIKSYLLILIALWLPLQAAAAATMPFCRHAAEQVTMEGVHCHEQVDEPSTAAAGDLDCDNCAMCHLATAGYLLVTAENLPPLAASILVPKLKPASPSHIPEPPQQPPRRTT